MEEIISQYNFLVKAYISKLNEFLKKEPNFCIPDNSTFRNQEDYIRFREESLNKLLKVLQNITTQLDKYGKFKTLDPKIIRMAERNSLTQGKFYDYAIGHYAYKDMEPELFELIESNFTNFNNLSIKITSLKKQG